MRKASIIHLFIILLIAFVGISAILPMRNLPASAPDDQFSAERALLHLKIIAAEAHPSGSPAQAKVRDYLLAQLSAIGLKPELQKASGAENVLARLKGSKSEGAILIQAHYDSFAGPGAVDNGAGTAALLEIMRALTAGPAPRNDVIVLFSDSEELPDAFTGTKAFVRSHPWMADVRVAIGLDTASRGFISTNDLGENNGWLVRVLARAYTNGAWSSMSGGGGYDTLPFKQAGVRVLQLEDNYPYVEQHTRADVVELVRPGSLQQLGEQALAVARQLLLADLSNTSSPQRSFLFLPYIALIHYPESWAPPLAVLAGLMWAAALVLALRRGVITWKGFGVSVLTLAVCASVSAAAVSAFWKAAPKWFDWPVQSWREWPEVIPPGGWLIFCITFLIILILFIFAYRIARRWASSSAFAIAGLIIPLLVALIVSFMLPASAVLCTWPVLIGSAVWVAALRRQANARQINLERAALLAAIPTLLYLLPLLPGVFMGDGTKSTAIEAGVWVFVLGVVLPGLDGLIARAQDQAAD